MSIIDQASSKKKRFADSGDGKPPEKRQKLPVTNKNKPSIKNSVSSISNKKLKPRNKNIPHELIESTVPRSNKRNVSSQMTVSRHKNKKYNTSVSLNSVQGSSRTQAKKILPVTKLRSSTNIFDIRKNLSRLESSIEKHNSRRNQSSRVKSSKEIQTASKCESSLIKQCSTQESKSREIPKIRVKIKKAKAVRKTAAVVKKNQKSKLKAKQKGKEKMVTTAQGGKKRRQKNKVMYVVTIHPVGRKDENGFQYEEVDLTIDTEHLVESDHSHESFAESGPFCSAATLNETMDKDSNIETIPVPTSSTKLILDELSNTGGERPDLESSTESRFESDIQIESETLHLNPQINSFRISSPDTESQTHVNPKNTTFSLSKNIKRYMAADIEYKRAKLSDSSTQRESPIEGNKISNIETEESTGQNAPLEIETQNHLQTDTNTFQNIVPRSIPREINRKVPCFPVQTHKEEHRIRTRCIKPKELKRRTPSQATGPSWFRYLYTALYGTGEED